MLPRQLSRYLTRSRHSFMFHVRIPAELDRSRPLVTICLHTCSRSKASRLTANLTARAQGFFEDAIDQTLLSTEKLINCGAGRHAPFVFGTMFADNLCGLLEAELARSVKASETAEPAAAGVVTQRSIGSTRENRLSTSNVSPLFNSVQGYADNAPCSLGGKWARKDGENSGDWGASARSEASRYPSRLRPCRSREAIPRG